MDRGFIKLDRKLLDWRWAQNPNMVALWVWLLLNANWEDKDFEGITLHRGELATSYAKIAESVGITYRQARLALERLKSGREVAITRHSKYLVISIEKYNEYQSDGNQKAIKGQSNGNQMATTKELKKLRIKENIYSAYANVSLSDEEYAQLQKDYPNDCSRLIDEVGEWKAKSGAEYKSDYAAIKSFARKQGITEFEIKDYTIENEFEWVDDGTVRTHQVRVYQDGHTERS